MFALITHVRTCALFSRLWAARCASDATPSRGEERMPWVLGHIAYVHATPLCSKRAGNDALGREAPGTYAVLVAFDKLATS